MAGTRIGLPAETRDNEMRVAATPETFKKYVRQGFRVQMETLGRVAVFLDDAYLAVGAEIIKAVGPHRRPGAHGAIPLRRRD
ncbi:hypothetical protein [Paraburkholderia xenovorans]|uniref:hypothetical protein n=1 Tax=Paraburkholderia xenovorans TaxID=36873 RepID=UPI0038B73345